MADPLKYKNHVFENVDVVIYFCSTRQPVNHFFECCLEAVSCTNINYFFEFADQWLPVNEKKNQG